MVITWGFDNVHDARGAKDHERASFFFRLLVEMNKE